MGKKYNSKSVNDIVSGCGSDIMEEDILIQPDQKLDRQYGSQFSILKSSSSINRQPSAKLSIAGSFRKSLNQFLTKPKPILNEDDSLTKPKPIHNNLPVERVNSSPNEERLGRYSTSPTNKISLVTTNLQRLNSGKNSKRNPEEFSSVGSIVSPGKSKAPQTAIEDYSNINIMTLDPKLRLYLLPDYSEASFKGKHDNILTCRNI
jgi:hypothetical protein